MRSIPRHFPVPAPTASVTALRRWASYLWQRITTEPGYADGLAALAFTCAELFIAGHRLRRILQELARTSALVIQALLEQERGRSGYERLPPVTSQAALPASGAR